VKKPVFITGATGYMGRRLAAELIRRGYAVRALVRPGSESRLAPGCEAVSGDALDPSGYERAVRGCETFVQLVGVSHPSPANMTQFQRVDGAAGSGAVAAARRMGVAHFIYVSVAQPAPVMGTYVAALAAVEDDLRGAGFAATILRPCSGVGRSGHSKGRKKCLR